MPAVTQHAVDARAAIAQLGPACPAVVAAAATRVMKDHDPVADPERCGIDARADRGHDAARFMTADDWSDSIRSRMPSMLNDSAIPWR